MSSMAAPELKGKVALVTGASRGIGAAITRRLAREGASVVLGYAQSSDAAEALAREIAESGGQALAVRADLSRPDQAARLPACALERFSRLDILINNAAVAEWLPLSRIDAEHFERVYSVNVRGLLLLCHHAAPHLAEGGRIVNLSSGVAQVPAPSAAVYASSKAAVEALTRCLSAELGPRGITVNAIAPGLVATEMLAAAMPEERVAALVGRTALGRVGQPEDIADVVAFLCSHDGRWITGQVIAVSGGLYG